jgi:CheY-specific phosphatase CheX
MLRIVKGEEISGVVGIVEDREGKVLFSINEETEAEVLSAFSHLVSTMNEGYRSGIVREGF